MSASTGCSALLRQCGLTAIAGDFAIGAKNELLGGIESEQIGYQLFHGLFELQRQGKMEILQGTPQEQAELFFGSLSPFNKIFELNPALKEEVRKFIISNPKSFRKTIVALNEAKVSGKLEAAKATAEKLPTRAFADKNRKKEIDDAPTDSTATKSETLRQLQEFSKDADLFAKHAKQLGLLATNLNLDPKIAQSISLAESAAHTAKQVSDLLSLRALGEATPLSYLTVANVVLSFAHKLFGKKKRKGGEDPIAVVIKLQKKYLKD
jgi:hypothetical protein